MTHRTPTAWRKLAYRELGPIPDIVWNLVAEKGYIDAANNEVGMVGDEAALEGLIDDVENELTSYAAYQTSRPRLPQRQDKEAAQQQDKEATPDSLIESSKALGQVIGCLLNKEERLRGFRQSVLESRLLSPEKVPLWVKSVAASEPPDQEVSLRFPADINLKPGFESAAMEALAAHQENRQPLGYGYKTLTLSFPSTDGPWTESVPISTGGTLARLKALAGEYDAFWPEAAVVQFILTNKHFPVIRAKAGYGDMSGIPYVSLRIHPSLSGDEVRKIYLSTRNMLKGWPGNSSAKGLNKKHLALAVAAAEKIASWDKTRGKWNKAYPEWAYPASARATFARDCRVAYERLTGWKWKE